MSAAKKAFLKEFPKAVLDDAAAIFVGAGVSVGAGYPSWKGLLKDIGEELGVSSDDVQDLAALAQWSVRKSAGRTRINNVIKQEIDVDKPIPDALTTLARLPVRNIWTTNYDELIERAFAAIGRPIDRISVKNDLSLRPTPGAVRLFKMHGSITQLDSIVIATDDYELYRVNRGAFLPLLQAHMTSFSMLFVGLSFTDPNVKHVLSLIRESFSSSPPEHFAIVRPPQRSDYKTAKEHKARLAQHVHWADDLLRYGLRVIEIENFDEVPKLMFELERRVASQRVWISGSWPTSSSPDPAREYVAKISAGLGRMVGEEGYSLVSGQGLTVGPESISAFLNALQVSGHWDLERRLLVRPFPQPSGSGAPNKTQWSMLRKEMARVAGTVIFLGGVKLNGGQLINADGVEEELKLVSEQQAFLIPIGAAGGTGKAIAERYLAGSLPASAKGRYPSKAAVRKLMKPLAPEKIVELVQDILRQQWF